jgi:TrmH family RNA methyltransferase
MSLSFPPEIEALRISARDNPLLQRIRKLLADPGGYRKAGQVWLEGDHLVSAALARGWMLEALVMTDAAWTARADWQAWTAQARRTALVSAELFRGLCSLESPVQVGALVSLPQAPSIQPGVFTVVLDRLQDAGNVGSILRSAAAFGARQVLALKGTAALWSPKVLRAGMGAHFGLSLVEALSADDLAALDVPLLATSSHAGRVLGQGACPGPAPGCWAMKGRASPGADATLRPHRQHPQPGGEESLNVGAAAAICLFASATGAQSTPAG